MVYHGPRWSSGIYITQRGCWVPKNCQKNVSSVSKSGILSVGLLISAEIGPGSDGYMWGAADWLPHVCSCQMCKSGIMKEIGICFRDTAAAGWHNVMHYYQGPHLLWGSLWLEWDIHQPLLGPLWWSGAVYRAHTLLIQWYIPWPVPIDHMVYILCLILVPQCERGPIH